MVYGMSPDEDKEVYSSLRPCPVTVEVTLPLPLSAVRLSVVAGMIPASSRIAWFPRFVT
jgi:hypothetical protein